MSAERSKPPGRAVQARALVVAALALLSSAATPGDIGGCGQPADDLDATVFYDSLEKTDCTACQRCGFTTATCDAACGTTHEAVPVAFPLGCAPLAHDGEVCLRRLQYAACDEYEPYVSDDAAGAPLPLVARPRPTECQFCPPR